MPRGSKKGRLSGGARKEINERRAADAVRSASKGVTDGNMFARVTRILGANHVRVAVPCKAGVRELSARIPNIFARRGATPITTRDVVAIFVGAEFDVDKDTVRPSDHFDITTILTTRQSHALFKDGIIPQWMIHDEAADAAKGKITEDVGYEFDYSDVKEEMGSDDDSDHSSGGGARGGERTADDDVDVDAI
jgi:translation initiation factor IF-1